MQKAGVRKMSDSKLSLEDILNEYKPDPDDKSSSHVGRADARKLIIAAVADEKKDVKAPRPAAVSHEKKELFDSEEKTFANNEISPAERSVKKAAFADAEGINLVYADTAETPSMPLEGAPKIRRMADSTRAKEAEKEKKKRKKKRHSQTREKRTYSKETPEGEYMYTPPEFSKKKRTRTEIINEAEDPENRKFLTDIVPSREAANAARPVSPTPRSSTTQLDLSRREQVDEKTLDVHVPRSTEEYTHLQTKSKRTKRIVDFNYYGDVQDVGRDIYELKNTISNRVAVLFLTSFLSLYMTVCSRFDLPILSFLSIGSINTYLIAHLILGVLSLVYSIPVITKGFRNLVRLKADGDSMTAITAVSCLVGLLAAFGARDMAQAETIHIYMPVGILALFFNAVGKLLIMKRAKRNFNFVSKNFDRHGVVYVKDEERAERLTRGTLGDFPILAAMRPTDYLTDFLRYTYSSDITDTFCRHAAPICLIFSAVTSVFVTFFRMGTFFSGAAIAFGFSIFSMLICASSCIAIPFAANIPLEKVSKQTLKNKGILLGYQSVDDLYDTNSVLAPANILFPAGSIKLGGIKVFSNTKPDEAFLDAASLACHGKSLMTQLFADIIENKEDLLYKIDNFSYEEDMGLCGWINNRRVLLGSRELMIAHNIEGLPTKSEESDYAQGRDSVYLSISGNLAAMFVVDVSGTRSVKIWAERLTKKKICIIVKTVDPFITQNRIAAALEIPAGMVKVLPQKLHQDFDIETRKSESISASMACTGKFSSMAQLILGIKKIHASAITALIFQTASILLGFGLSMMLILSKAFEFDYMYMSATAMTIYNLICTALTCFAAGAKKLS